MNTCVYMHVLLNLSPAIPDTRAGRKQAGSGDPVHLPLATRPQQLTHITHAHKLELTTYRWALITHAHKSNKPSSRMLTSRTSPHHACSQVGAAKMQVIPPCAWTWVTYVFFMSYICILHELHMYSAWVTYVFCMSYICILHILFGVDHAQLAEPNSNH
jgi:hypothetical protein